MSSRPHSGHPTVRHIRGGEYGHVTLSGADCARQLSGRQSAYGWGGTGIDSVASTAHYDREDKVGDIQDEEGSEDEGRRVSQYHRGKGELFLDSGVQEMYDFCARRRRGS